MTTRSFAEKNPDAVKAFRASIDEAAAIVNSDREKASVAIAKFTHLPIEIVRLNRPGLSDPKLKASDFAWWIDVMKQQDMLQTNVDASKLIFP